MPYVIVDDVIVWTPDTAGLVTVKALDGTSDTFSPGNVDGWRPDRDSANVIQNRLDGSVNVILRGDRPRTGSLEMSFDSDLEAERAAAILGRPTTFQLTDAERPALSVTFARAGRLSTPIHDDVRDVWEFSIGYQEVTP